MPAPLKHTHGSGNGCQGRGQSGGSCQPRTRGLLGLRISLGVSVNTLQRRLDAFVSALGSDELARFFTRFFGQPWAHRRYILFPVSLWSVFADCCCLCGVPVGFQPAVVNLSLSRHKRTILGGRYQSFYGSNAIDHHYLQQLCSGFLNKLPSTWIGFFNSGSLGIESCFPPVFWLPELMWVSEIMALIYTCKKVIAHVNIWMQLHPCSGTGEWASAL